MFLFINDKTWLSCFKVYRSNAPPVSIVFVVSFSEKIFIVQTNIKNNLLNILDQSLETIYQNITYFGVEMGCDTSSKCKIVMAPSLASYGKEDDYGNFILSTVPSKFISKIIPEPRMSDHWSSWAAFTCWLPCISTKEIIVYEWVWVL